MFPATASGRCTRCRFNKTSRPHSQPTPPIQRKSENLNKPSKRKKEESLSFILEGSINQRCLAGATRNSSLAPLTRAAVQGGRQTRVPRTLRGLVGLVELPIGAPVRRVDGRPVCIRRKVDRRSRGAFSFSRWVALPIARCSREDPYTAAGRPEESHPPAAKAKGDSQPSQQYRESKKNMNASFGSKKTSEWTAFRQVRRV